MNAAEFAHGLAVLEKGFGKELDSGQRDVWFGLLKDLPAGHFQKACARAVQSVESNWLPSIATLRKFCMESQEGLMASPEQAWARLTKAMRCIGYTLNEQQSARVRTHLGETLWQTVAAMGGWNRLCGMDDPRTTLYAQFREGWLRAAAHRKEQLTLSEAVRPAMVGLPQAAKTLAAQMLGRVDELKAIPAKKTHARIAKPADDV